MLTATVQTEYYYENEMKDERFDRAYYYMLENEGGFVNDKDDKGGATKYGISLRFLKQMFDQGSAWVDLNKDKKIDERDILLLTLSQIKNIYYEQFWKPIKDLKPDLLGIKIFDMAVNIGQGQAIKLLQKVVGAKQDGILGPKTQAAIDKKDLDCIFVGLVEELCQYYYRIAGGVKSKYIVGWRRRAFKLPK